MTDSEGPAWVGDHLMNLKHVTITPLPPLALAATGAGAAVRAAMEWEQEAVERELRGHPEDMLVTSWGSSVTWEVTVSEETFWRIAETFLGPEEVLEMKDYVAELARWEGDGGACMP